MIGSHSTPRGGPGRRRRRHLLLALVAVLAWRGGMAHAVCTGGVLVSATPMAFGSFTGQTKRTMGTLSLTCAGVGTTGFSIALSQGNSGSFASRRLQSGTASLSYNLYTTPACTQVWGDGTAGSAVIQGQFSLNGAPSQTLQQTIHGCLPAQPVPSPGLYTDTIVVTVSF